MPAPRSFACDNQGGVAVIFALALMPLVASVGAAIDYTRVSREQTQMQAALDGALMAGALADNPVDVATRAYQGQRGPGAGGAVRFWTDATGVLRGTATMEVPTEIMSVLGFKSMPASVRGGVTIGGRQGNVCVLLLAPSGTGLTMNSSSNIDMPHCEIHVRSTADGAVVVNSSSALVTKRLCVAGQITLNSAPSRQSYEAGCKPVDDPFAGKLPVPPAGTTCTHTNQTINSNTNPTINANSVICGTMNFNSSGTVTFAPGLHRIRGGINFGSADIVADGVTFYFESSSSFFQMNSSAKMRLTPPTSGTYAGISMFEPPGITTYTNLILNSATDVQTSGLFYLPSRNVTINSAGNLLSRRLTMLARTGLVNSSSYWKVDVADDPSRRISLGGAAVFVE
jgi:hypothetical protein